LLNAAQAYRDRRQQERRAAQDRVVEERRAARERANAEDRAREETLHTYLQQMSDLLARPGTRSTRGEQVLANGPLARTLSLVALRGLDPARKGLVLQFLMEADLISRTTAWDRSRRGVYPYNCFVATVDDRLSRAERRRARRALCGKHAYAALDLTGADLRGAVMPDSLNSFVDGAGPGGRYRTRAAVLDGADLRDSDFRGRYLMGVSFLGADLRGADLSGAQLGATSFSQACLSSARFVRASSDYPDDFAYAEGRSVDFTNADLYNANFGRAKLTDVTLTGAFTRGARWPSKWTTTGIRMREATAGRLCNEFR
jgi:uncharacterized protein YjbI with pentapeptide repeats